MHDGPGIICTKRSAQDDIITCHISSYHSSVMMSDDVVSVQETLNDYAVMMSDDVKKFLVLVAMFQ